MPYLRKERHPEVDVDFVSARGKKMEQTKSKNRDEETRRKESSRDKGQNWITGEDLYREGDDDAFTTKTEGDLGIEKGKLVEIEAMQRGKYDPTVRRSALKRTPPSGSTLKVPSSRDSSIESNKSTEKTTENEDRVSDQENRKRQQEDSPEGARNRDKMFKKPTEERSKEHERMKRKNLVIGKSQQIREITKLLNKVNDGVAGLHLITAQSRNTKVEIKDLADELSKLMYSLMAKDWAKIDEKMAEKRKSTSEVGVQANIKPRNKRIESVSEVDSLEGYDTFTKWRTIAARKWDPEIYKNTDIKNNGEVINTDDDTVKVIIVGKDDRGQPDMVVGKGWERFPELNKIKEDYVILEQTTNIRTGNDRKVVQKIIRIAVCEDEEDLWKKLEKVRDEMRGAERVAIRHPTGRNVTEIRKMLEVIFRDTGAKVSLYTEGKNRQKGGERTEPTREKRLRETYALIVDGGTDKEYRQVLQQVRDTLGNNTAKNLIRGLRSTRDGKLLITTDRDQRAIEKVENILRENTENLRIANTGREDKEQAIYIRGLDALTTKDEVVGAIEAKIGSLAGKKYKVSELRPTINDTLAVTIVLNERDAEQLVAGGKIRIGMVNCLAERKLKIERCYKCWAYDHKAQACSNITDRSRICYRCGETGHNARTCKNEEACPICEERGHSADSRNCKAFRRALAQARREEREREARKEGDRMEQEMDPTPISNYEENYSYENRLKGLPVPQTS